MKIAPLPGCRQLSAAATALCFFISLADGADESSGTVAIQKYAGPVHPVRQPVRRRVLLIGDSLTVGPFGEALEKSLIAAMGRENVWVYGSCGSGVDSWLASEPVFFTPCGYRETTPAHQRMEDYHGSKKPQRVPTPKIETLLKKEQPEILIVQLGTNHFDFLERDGKAGIPKQTELFVRFAAAVSRTAGTVQEVIWIAPPDCARFPDWIQAAVGGMIKDVASHYHFHVVDSRHMTRYITGQTGSDGVHYLRDPAYAWANLVIDDINRILQW